MRTLECRIGLVATMALVGSASIANAQWLYEIVRANPLAGTGSAFFDHTVVGRFSDGTTLLGASSLDHPIVVDGSSRAWDAWIFDSVTGRASLIGLRDAEHTASNGSSLAFVGTTNGQWYWYDSDIEGAVFGYSVRFAGDSPNGYSAWAFVPGAGTPSGGETRRLGFFDQEHTRHSDGRRVSQITIGRGAWAAGVSERYGPTGSPTATSAGHDGWWYRGIDGATVPVGLYDPLHVDPTTGRRECQPLSIAPTGRVFGTSALYHSATLAPGASVWTFDPANGITTRIGLLDAAHTDAASGYHRSAFWSANARGDAIGSTERYEAGRDVGQSGWLYLASTGECLRVGLTDADHTSPSGTQSTWLLNLEDNGVVRGVSLRWQVGTVSATEQTPFVFDIATRTYHILPGLTDAQHTGPGGEHRAYSQGVIGRHVIGSSYRWFGSNFGGYTLWEYNLDTHQTRRVAPPGAEYDDPTVPYRASGGSIVSSPAGSIVLAATTFARTPPPPPAPLPPPGVHAWIYDLDTGVAHRLGYDDAPHTNASGATDTTADDHVLADRYVLGTSTRFDPPGISTWLYDMQTGATVPIEGVRDANHTGRNGSTRQFVSTIVPDRWVAGMSERYDASGSTIGYTSWVLDLTTLATTVFAPDEPVPSYFYPLSSDLSPQGRFLAAYRDAGLAPVPPARVWSPAFGTRPVGAVVEPASRAWLLDPLFGAPSSLTDDASVVLWSRRSDATLPNISTGVFAWIPRPACPADFDDGSTLAIPDGGTTVEDLLYFLDRFDAGSLAADMDDGSGNGAHDNAVTIEDLLYFLAHFEEGC